mgnify:CR=1 FL=1
MTPNTEADHLGTAVSWQAAVIVPTYNEVDNLEPLVLRLLGLDAGLGIVVVDDGSPDGTGALADRLAAGHPEVHVIHRACKLGLGTAYRAGFDYCLQRDIPLVLTMDADFSHDPQHIPAMLSAAQHSDLVIGSRYVRGGAARDCVGWRVALSRVANLAARLLLRLDAHDCTAGFRCYRAAVLRRLDLDAIRSEGYSYLIEMLYWVQQAGWRVSEVPIVFVNRRRGSSKISKHEIGRALATVLHLWRVGLSHGHATRPAEGELRRA